MQQNYKEIQQQFIGFLNTPNLWKNNTVYELKQLNITSKEITYSGQINGKLRLGKYIERFVSFLLNKDKTIKIIAENIQIQRNKITLGELDCLFLKNNKPIHLEIVYKFYLFDETAGLDEVSHFIGPNRKDSLKEKLVKLQQKQLPLLYTNEAIAYLKSVQIDLDVIEQQVLFKAQLFVPYSKKHTQIQQLNSECIVGYYINQLELYEFEYCKFYIPSKKNWLVKPHKNVNWLNFDDFYIEFNNYLQRQFSPLCWIKNQNGTLDKAFIVWW